MLFIVNEMNKLLENDKFDQLFTNIIKHLLVNCFIILISSVFIFMT